MIHLSNPLGSSSRICRREAETEITSYPLVMELCLMCFPASCRSPTARLWGGIWGTAREPYRVPPRLGWFFEGKLGWLSAGLAS